MRRIFIVSGLLAVFAITGVTSAFQPKAAPQPAERKQMSVVVLKVGEERTIQHESQKQLRQVNRFNSNVVRIRQLDGNTRTVRLQAETVGGTRIELVDEDMKKETLVILVEAADAK
jgi:hypothetical protein